MIEKGLDVVNGFIFPRHCIYIMSLPLRPCRLDSRSVQCISRKGRGSLSLIRRGRLPCWF